MDGVITYYVNFSDKLQFFRHNFHRLLAIIHANNCYLVNSKKLTTWTKYTAHPDLCDFGQGRRFSAAAIHSIAPQHQIRNRSPDKSV